MNINVFIAGVVAGVTMAVVDRMITSNSTWWQVLGLCVVGASICLFNLYIEGIEFKVFNR